MKCRKIIFYKIVRNLKLRNISEKVVGWLEKTWKVIFEDGTFVDLDDNQAEEFRQLTWVPGNEFRKMPQINNTFLKSPVREVLKLM